MELTAIGPDVYACLQPDRGLGWSNSGLIARGGGLVVDTFWDLPRTRSAMELFAPHLDGADAARQLVVTHHNGDHCYGNQLYAEAGSEIIGHRLCAEYMGRDAGPGFLKAMAETDLDELPEHLRPFSVALRDFDFDGVEVTPPTTTMDDELTLDVGGTEVRVEYLGPAHTAGDVIVHLPEHGIVFTGDLLFHQCTPIGWEGTSAQWCAALDHIAALEPETVVPGHGPLATPEGLLEMRDYLAYVFSEAEQHHAAGRTPLEAAKRIELGRWAGWNEPERLAFNVHRAYRELDGKPWDEQLDVMEVFADVGRLRAAYEANEGV